MTAQEKTNLLDQKRALVVDAFVRYRNRSVNNNRENISAKIEYITSTMRLEGEPVTSDDVRRVLQSS